MKKAAISKHLSNCQTNHERHIFCQTTNSIIAENECERSQTETRTRPSSSTIRVRRRMIKMNLVNVFALIYLFTFCRVVNRQLGECRRELDEAEARCLRGTRSLAKAKGQQAKVEQESLAWHLKWMEEAKQNYKRGRMPDSRDPNNNHQQGDLPDPEDHDNNDNQQE